MVKIKKPVFSYNCDFNCSTFGLKFDFILAQSIFSHASQSQIKKALSEAKKVMKTDSIFVATFMQGNTDYNGEKWVYPAVVTYTLEKMSELVKEQQLDLQKIDFFHPAGQTWIIIFHPENKKIFSLINNDFATIQNLRMTLKACQERLSRIEKHPYVKMGLAVRRFFLNLFRKL